MKKLLFILSVVFVLIIGVGASFVSCDVNHYSDSDVSLKGYSAEKVKELSLKKYASSGSNNNNDNQDNNGNQNGGGEKFPQAFLNLCDTINYYVYQGNTYNVDGWSSFSFSGYTDVLGYDVWSDGSHIYCSKGSTQYELNTSTFTWISKSWTGLTNFDGYNIWTDGSHIYYSKGSTQYVLNGSTWSSKSWTGLTNFDGCLVWSDGSHIYYSSSSTQYELNGSTWSSKSWTGLSSFGANYIWNDGSHIYYSNGSKHYQLNGSTWSSKSWTGLTDFVGGYVWSDGSHIYYSNDSIQYELNGSTWISKTWPGLSSFYGTNVYVIGDNYMYYSSSGNNYRSYSAPSTYTITINGNLIGSYDEDTSLLVNSTGLYNSSTNTQLYTYNVSGYTFNGFSLTSGGSVYYGVNSIIPLTSDLSLYSVGTAIPPSSYTITIDGNLIGSYSANTSLLVNSSGLYNSSTNTQLYTYNVSNYIFNGFSLTSGGSVYYGVNSIIPLTSDLIFYSVGSEILSFITSVGLWHENNSAVISSWVLDGVNYDSIRLYYDLSDVSSTSNSFIPLRYSLYRNNVLITSGNIAVGTNYVNAYPKGFLSCFSEYDDDWIYENETSIRLYYSPLRDMDYSVNIVDNESYGLVYNIGFSDGYLDGVDSNISTNPIRYMFEFAVDLMATQLFPGFSVGTLLILAIGVVFLGIIIKLWVH